MTTTLETKLMTSNIQASNALLALDSPTATLALVGGKGANLAKLARANFPVPGGFLVTTQAYAEFVAANRLDTWIQTIVAQADPNGSGGVRGRIDPNSYAFCCGTIPSPLAADLRHAYQTLASCWWRRALRLPRRFAGDVVRRPTGHLSKYWARTRSYTPSSIVGLVCGMCCAIGYRTRRDCPP